MNRPLAIIFFIPLAAIILIVGTFQFIAEFRCTYKSVKEGIEL